VAGRKIYIVSFPGQKPERYVKDINGDWWTLSEKNTPKPADKKLYNFINAVAKAQDAEDAKEAEESSEKVSPLSSAMLDVGDQESLQPEDKLETPTKPELTKQPLIDPVKLLEPPPWPRGGNWPNPKEESVEQKPRPPLPKAPEPNPNPTFNKIDDWNLPFTDEYNKKAKEKLNAAAKYTREEIIPGSNTNKFILNPLKKLKERFGPKDPWRESLDKLSDLDEKEIDILKSRGVAKASEKDFSYRKEGKPLSKEQILKELQTHYGAVTWRDSLDKMSDLDENEIKALKERGIAPSSEKDFSYRKEGKPLSKEQIVSELQEHYTNREEELSGNKDVTKETSDGFGKRLSETRGSSFGNYGGRKPTFAERLQEERARPFGYDKFDYGRGGKSDKGGSTTGTDRVGSDEDHLKSIDKTAKAILFVLTKKDKQKGIDKENKETEDQLNEDLEKEGDEPTSNTQRVYETFKKGKKSFNKMKERFSKNKPDVEDVEKEGIDGVKPLEEGAGKVLPEAAKGAAVAEGDGVAEGVIGAGVGEAEGVIGAGVGEFALDAAAIGAVGYGAYKAANYLTTPVPSYKEAYKQKYGHEPNATPEKKPPLNEQTKSVDELQNKKDDVQEEKSKKNNQGSPTIINNNNTTHQGSSGGGGSFGDMATAGPRNSLDLQYYAA